MSRKRAYSAANFDAIAQAAPKEFEDELQEHHGPEATLECRCSILCNCLTLLPSPASKLMRLPRYMGIELHDGTFDANAELWANTKIVFEWILTCPLRAL